MMYFFGNKQHYVSVREKWGSCRALACAGVRGAMVGGSVFWGGTRVSTRAQAAMGSARMARAARKRSMGLDDGLAVGFFKLFVGVEFFACFGEACGDVVLCYDEFTAIV